MDVVLAVLTIALAASLIVVLAAIVISETNARQEATRQRVRSGGVEWAHRYYLANHDSMSRTQRAVFRECIEGEKRRYER